MTRLIAPAIVFAVVAACSSSPGTTTTTTLALSVDHATGLVADNNAQATFTATATDSNGKAVDVSNMTFTATGTGNGMLNPVKSAAGVFTTTLTSTRAEKKSVTAVATVGNGTISSNAVDVEFVGGPAAQVTFVVQPGTTKAGAIITPAVVLSVTDQNGNLPSDATTFALRLVRSSNGTLSGGTAKPVVDGGVVFDQLSVNHPQTGYALRAEAPSGLANESMQFDVTPGDPSQATSTLLANPVNVVGSAMTTLTVTVMDLGANPLSGVAVSLAVDGTGNTLGASSGSTDAAGTFSTTLASSVPETKHVTATIGAITLTTTVVFVP
jgi:hypothetical protein